MTEWAETKLQDVSEDITVGFVGSMSALFVESGVPLLRGQNVHPGRLDLENLKYISLETHQKWKKSALNAGDVVIVRVGLPGTACVVPEGMGNLNAASLVIVRPDRSRLDPQYLCYLLNSKLGKQLVRSRLVGSVQQVFNTGTAASLEIPLPPLSEQKAIAAVLGTLDDKIELNRRMSETLEAMARALFKSWFVDFDPVRAKSEGRDPGLPKPLADLFPDSFEDSELGEVPRGWIVSTIGDIAEVVGGSTPGTDRAEFWEGGIHHWATPKDLSQLSTTVLLETERKVTELGLEQISSRLLPPGTVLLSSRAPIGYLAITEVPVAINQGFIAMKPRNGVPSTYLLHWARAYEGEIVSRANGSTFLEISKSQFRPIPIVMPGPAVMQVFAQQADLLHGRLVENERESRVLAACRESLLPKLISGELRVLGA